MKTYKMIGIAIGAAIVGLVVTLVVLNPNNYAETGENAANNLHTRRYDMSNQTYFNPNDSVPRSRAVMDIEWILSSQTTYGRSWKVKETLAEKDSAIIRAEVPVLFFTHDLEVQIQFAPLENPRQPQRKATVNVRSASRSDGSDLGENRRHIKQFLEALDFSLDDDRLKNLL